MRRRSKFFWRFGDNRSFRPVCRDWQGSDYLQVCLQKHSFLGDKFGDGRRDKALRLTRSTVAPPSGTLRAKNFPAPPPAPGRSNPRKLLCRRPITSVISMSERGIIATRLVIRGLAMTNAAVLSAVLATLASGLFALIGVVITSTLAQKRKHTSDWR